MFCEAGENIFFGMKYINIQIRSQENLNNISWWIIQSFKWYSQVLRCSRSYNSRADLSEEQSYTMQGLSFREYSGNNFKWYWSLMNTNCDANLKQPHLHRQREILNARLKRFTILDATSKGYYPFSRKYLTCIISDLRKWQYDDRDRMPLWEKWSIYIPEAEGKNYYRLYQSRFHSYPNVSKLSAGIGHQTEIHFTAYL